MEIQRFDALARQLSQGGTRRRLLSVFGGTALGGLMATTFGPEAEVEGKKKKKKKSCKKKKCGECQSCKKGKCLAKPNGTACSTGTCEGGVCVGINNCPPAQVCDLAETCCTEGIDCITDVCFCGENQQEICSCPAGDEYCEGTESAQCCLATDTCASFGACITETCSASNDFCELEWALCGENCGCVSSVGGINFCGSLDDFSCESPSECLTDADCGPDVCVNVGCRCGGGFRGMCLSACPVSRQGAADARSSHGERTRGEVEPLR